MKNIVVWAKFAPWAMLGVAAIWVAYEVTVHYGNCRADGVGKLGCLAVTMFVSAVEVCVFVAVTAIKLLLVVLP